MIIGALDNFVDPAASKAFFDDIRSDQKEYIWYEKAYHTILADGELTHKLTSDILNFIEHKTTEM